MAYEPTKGDYIKSDIKNFFDVEEDDNWLTSLLKGAGSLAGQSAVNTGVNIGDTLFGDKKLKDLDGQDLEDAFYSIPALKALKLAPQTIKHMAKVAKKGGLKKGIEAGLKMMGPGKGAAARTSKSQLAAMTGLGSKKSGLLNRGLKLGAAGVVGNELLNRSTPDGNFGLDDLTGDGKTEDAAVDAEETEEDDANAVNLDNPDGQMAMTPEGEAQAAMQAKANSMPDMVNRLGGSGSKMGNLAKGRVQAQANFMADDIIKAQKIQARRDASKAHREGVMADNWETSQIGRADGRAWNELDDDTRQEMQKRFMANMGSPYDSSKDAKQARMDKVINEFGGNYVSPDGETGAPGQLTKEQFMDKTGMRTEGTGITQNADGSFNTLEFGDTFENSGGMDSAEDYLGGVQGGDAMTANLQNFGPGSGSSTPNNSGKGMYTDQFGQQSELGKGTVRMSANDQDYGNANFKNKDDALGYINRGASLDEPAPEAPEEEGYNPNEGEEEEEGGFRKYAPYLAPLALAHPATRRYGAKMMPKFKKNMKQLGDDFYEATPIPRFPGQAPRLGNSPMQLPNKAPGLPHRAPGLPNRADPNIPAALPNKSMSAPAGRQVTPEQFRRGQTGMGPSERNAYRESQRDPLFRDESFILDDLL